jgi:hypothetical protein
LVQDNRLIRADDDDDKRKDDDDDDRRDDASAGKKLTKFITDATAALDSLSKRMDAMEKRRRDDDDDDRRKDDDDDRRRAKKDDDDDDRRKDDDDDDKRKDDDLPEGGEPGDPKIKAADKKKRKDAEEEEEKEEHEEKCDDDDDKRKDALPPAFLKKKGKKDDDDRRRAKDDDDDRRDDDDDDDDDKRKDDDDDDKRKDDDDDRRRKDSRSDSDTRRRLKRAEDALQDVIRAIPKRRTDDDINALADAQARADEVYTALGKRGAPRYLDGEDLMGYRRRLARDLKKHSEEWRDVNLHEITSNKAFDILERRIYADAMNVAMTPVTAEPGTLRAITKRSGGHEITEFVGEPRAWMNDFAGLSQAVTGQISVSSGNQR